jgi:hypothetical protein
VPNHDTPGAPALGAMLEEVTGLGSGLTVMLMPLLVTALPGVILFLVLPVVLVAAALLVPPLLLAPPYLLARRLAARRPGRR